MHRTLATALALWVCACNKETPPSEPPEPRGDPQAEGADAGETTAESGPRFRPYQASDFAQAIVDAPDRSADDRKTDLRRRPADLLTFMEVAEGQKVAEIGAGAGYTTELLARAVGETGIVYAHNDTFALQNFARDSWPARLDKPVTRNVVRVDREFADPLPPEAQDLDAVVVVLAYHDAVARGSDIDAMNRAVFDALLPGGLYVVVDHSASAGRGLQDVETLHRIEEAQVIEQIERAGFELVESASFLRDPADTRDWKIWERGFVTDRFALKFQKPSS